MITLTAEEESVLAALSFVALGRKPASAGRVAKRAGLSPQKTTPLLRRLAARKLTKRLHDGYVMTDRGDQALDDNWIPDPASIGGNRQWLRDHAEAYWGRHVALRGNRLIAEGTNTFEVLAKLEAMKPHEEVLIVPLIEVGPLWVTEREA